MSNFQQTTIYEDITGSLYYARLKEPDYGHNPLKLPLAQLDAQEQKYKVVVAVSKDDYQAFIKKYPKKKSTPIENDEFLIKYKVTEVPYPNQPMQYTLTFKQKVFKKDGGLMPDSMRPKAFQFIDGVQEDITMTTLIGNGSKGVVRYSAWDRGGEIPITVSLQAVCVTELVPYAASDKPKRVDPNSFQNI